jgi:hypothetical protein
MPSNKSSNSGDYKYTGSGTNNQVSGLVDRVFRDYVLTGSRQGNHYCARDYGSEGTGYHYSNSCVVLYRVIGLWW